MIEVIKSALRNENKSQIIKDIYLLSREIPSGNIYVSVGSTRITTTTTTTTELKSQRRKKGIEYEDDCVISHNRVP